MTFQPSVAYSRRSPRRTSIALSRSLLVRDPSDCMRTLCRGHGRRRGCSGWGSGATAPIDSGSRADPNGDTGCPRCVGTGHSSQLFEFLVGAGEADFEAVDLAEPGGRILGPRSWRSSRSRNRHRSDTRFCAMVTVAPLTLPATASSSASIQASAGGRSSVPQRIRSTGSTAKSTMRVVSMAGLSAFRRFAWFQCAGRVRTTCAPPLQVGRFVEPVDQGHRHHVARSHPPRRPGRVAVVGQGPPVPGSRSR
jgi:hypothetical protein